jgi:hypothetical protein
VAIPRLPTDILDCSRRFIRWETLKSNFQKWQSDPVANPGDVLAGRFADWKPDEQFVVMHVFNHKGRRAAMDDGGFDCFSIKGTRNGST